MPRILLLVLLCLSPTAYSASLTIDLNTDLAVGREFTRARVEVIGVKDNKLYRVHDIPVTQDSGLSGIYRVADFKNLRKRDYRVLVTLYNMHTPVLFRSNLHNVTRDESVLTIVATSNAP